LPRDAAVERTGRYLQGESPSGERGCPGVQGESPSGERGCPGVQGESPSGERGCPGGEGALGYSVSSKGMPATQGTALVTQPALNLDTSRPWKEWPALCRPASGRLSAYWWREESSYSPRNVAQYGSGYRHAESHGDAGSSAPAGCRAVD